MRDQLSLLEEQSVFVIREAYSQIENLAVLWSMGKDSTVLLHLIRKAFLGHLPFPVVHIDTSYKIPEMISWRDEYMLKNCPGNCLIVGRNDEALRQGMGPQAGRLNCCAVLKTQALLETVRKNKIQGLFLGIRHDEESSRGKERIVSPRNPDSSWSYKTQVAEVWHYYNLHLPENVEYRIHPLLYWSELDVWRYIKQEQLDLIPLYFARNGRRYRSLGCAPCTGTVVSEAKTVEEIICELEASQSAERSGRAQDQEHIYAMQRLRSCGYM